jgi:hypothetical protein
MRVESVSVMGEGRRPMADAAGPSAIGHHYGYCNFARGVRSLHVEHIV